MTQLIFLPFLDSRRNEWRTNTSFQSWWYGDSWSCVTYLNHSRKAELSDVVGECVAMALWAIKYLCIQKVLKHEICWSVACVPDLRCIIWLCTFTAPQNVMDIPPQWQLQLQRGWRGASFISVASHVKMVLHLISTLMNLHQARNCEVLLIVSIVWQCSTSKRVLKMLV